MKYFISKATKKYGHITGMLETSNERVIRTSPIWEEHKDRYIRCVLIDLLLSGHSVHVLDDLNQHHKIPYYPI